MQSMRIQGLCSNVACPPDAGLGQATSIRSWKAQLRHIVGYFYHIMVILQISSMFAGLVAWFPNRRRVWSG